MSDLFFSKNRFIKSEETKLAKPISNDPNKLGRRTVEDIVNDMHPLPKIENSIKEEKKDVNQQSNKLTALKNFKMWNHK